MNITNTCWIFLFSPISITLFSIKIFYTTICILNSFILVGITLTSLFNHFLPICFRFCFRFCFRRSIFFIWKIIFFNTINTFFIFLFNPISITLFSIKIFHSSISILNFFILVWISLTSLFHFFLFL